MLVQSIPLQKTLPIRKAILRESYPLDWHDDTHHFGAYLDEKLIGVCSLFHENPQEQVGQGAYRIRAMGVLPAHRHEGVGQCLLSACIEEAKKREAAYIWCNAQTKAKAFYAKYGLEVVGDETHLPGLDPHYFFRLVF